MRSLHPWPDVHYEVIRNTYEHVCSTKKVTSLFILSSLFRGETKKYTLQGTSIDERKAWLEILEGKEPVSKKL